jgi:hypothetical protein
MNSDSVTIKLKKFDIRIWYFHAIIMPNQFHWIDSSQYQALSWRKFTFNHYYQYGVWRKQEVLEWNNRLFSYDTTWAAEKTTPPTILRCRRNVFTKLLPSNIDMDRMESDEFKNSSIAPCILVAAGTSLPSCYLVT